jgi:hypothetical protein
MYELDNLLHERNENLKIQIYESPGYVYGYNFLSINIKTDNKIISFEASIIWIYWILALINEIKNFNTIDEFLFEFDNNKLIIYSTHIYINNKRISVIYQDINNVNYISDIENSILKEYTSNLRDYKIYIELHHNQLILDWFSYNIFFLDI